MKLTADAVYGFTQGVLLSGFDDPKPTPNFHKELWEHCTSEDRYVAIAAPRGHAKSTAVTHAYCLASIMFREADFVLIVSDTESQAISFLGDIKKELLENQHLINLFGIRGLEKDSATDVICKMKDGHQFRIVAKGSEQKVRGLKWRGKRPNLIICDDLENDEIVMNEERRFKFRSWFMNALLPCGSDSCKVRAVGTILHLDSLLNRLMPQMELESTVTSLDGLKTYSTDKTRAWRSVLYRAHVSVNDFSNILWPEKFSEERLTAERQKYLDDGFLEGYSQEYLNNPIDETVAYFRKEDFKDIDPEDDDPLEFYAAIDMAISGQDQRAYTAIVVAGLTPKNILKIVDVRRFRGDSREIIDEMFSVHERYKPELFIVEDENISKSVGPFLEEEMYRRGRFLNLEKKSPIKDKKQRARSLQARFRVGSIQVNKQASWWPEFYQEFLYFPRGKFSDQVDAAAWIGMTLDKMTPVPTWAELEDMEYDDEVSESYYFGYQGQDAITGY
jgi:predicted phage terminase large subunit-like protein